MPEAVARWSWDHDPAAVRALLDAGGVLAIPSESSYGLAVEPTSAAGVEAVYRLKQRDAGKPLLVVAASRAQLEALGVAAPEAAWRALEAAWPAPLTAVLPLTLNVARGNNLPAAAGSPTLAVRIPDHPRLRAWLARVGPVTATSANLSGEPPVLDADGAVELLAQLRDQPSPEPGNQVPVAVIQEDSSCEGEIDGALPGGPPSTLIAWAGDSQGAAAWRLLRAGRYDLTNTDFQPFMVPSQR